MGEHQAWRAWPRLHLQHTCAQALQRRSHPEGCIAECGHTSLGVSPGKELRCEGPLPSWCQPCRPSGREMGYAGPPADTLLRDSGNSEDPGLQGPKVVGAHPMQWGPWTWETFLSPQLAAGLALPGFRCVWRRPICSQVCSLDTPECTPEPEWACSME